MFLGIWVIIEHISISMQASYFTRQKYIYKEGEHYYQQFLINLEVFTCVNQKFLKTNLVHNQV